MIRMSIEEILAFYATKTGGTYAVAVPLDELRALKRAHDIYRAELERLGWTDPAPAPEGAAR